MSVSIIPAFQQIRLSGVYVTMSGSDNRMKVGNDAVLYERDSGNFISTAAQTGSILYNDIIGLSGIVTGDISNLTLTGQTLYNNIVGLSGLINNDGFISYINATGYTTGVQTGVFQQYINHPITFSRIPQVQLTLDVGPSGIFYFCGTSQRSATGFFAQYSDTVMETGLNLCVWASI